MHRASWLITVALALCGGLLLVSMNNNASAESLTSEQREHIEANCVGIKSSLNQLHVADALLRVNRGQLYETMASKLMDKFNGRLSLNHLDNQAMTTVSGNYYAALSTFRSDYIAYENKLSSAIAIDCTQQPDAFYEATEQARQLRFTVHSDVEKLHTIIDDYRSSVNSFLLNYERLTE